VLEREFSYSSPKRGFRNLFWILFKMFYDSQNAKKKRSLALNNSLGDRIVLEHNFDTTITSRVLV